MKVDVSYGRSHIEVVVPDGRADVIAPSDVRAAADPEAVLAAALADPTGAPPLAALEPDGPVVVAVCDHTRPQPRQPMIEAIRAALPSVADDQLTILVATGTHRPSSDDELVAMLGSDIVSRHPVVNHRCRHSPTVAFGTVAGDVPVAINAAWVEAALRISTGFVEPHFFAGFSGGPKLVTPGLAGLETVQALHSAARIGSDDATWGTRFGNPVHDAVRAAAATAPPHLAFDVVLNRQHEIYDGFAGELFAMHDRACATAAEVAMRPVDRRYEVVVTSNAGYPLDQNLYQAVKGMTAAARIAAPGGLIVSVAECADGVPDGSPFEDQITRGLSPSELRAWVEAADPPMPEQWQAQVLSRLQERFRIGLHNERLDDGFLHSVGIEPINDVSAAVAETLAADPDARVALLPDGPETIPYLEGATASV